MSKQVQPYKAPLTVNNALLFRTSSLAYKLGRLSLMGEKKVGRKEAGMAARYSLALEGIDLTPSQIRGLYQGQTLPNLPFPSKLADLYMSLGKTDVLDPSFKEKFEEAAFPDGVPTRLGRKAANWDYPLPPHAKVEGLLKALYRFAKAKQDDLYPLNLACYFYYELLAIAPYSKDNGIFARLLFKGVIGSFYKGLIACPIEEEIYHNKDKFDAALKEAVEKNDTAPFVEMMLILLERGVDKLLRASLTTSVGASGSPLVEKLLSKMEDGRFYSAAELLELLGLKSRLGLQKNYLRPGLDAKLLEMSNPLSPTSRSQRYRKKEKEEA